MNAPLLHPVAACPLFGCGLLGLGKWLGERKSDGDGWGKHEWSQNHPGFGLSSEDGPSGATIA